MTAFILIIGAFIIIDIMLLSIIKTNNKNTKILDKRLDDVERELRWWKQWRK